MSVKRKRFSFAKEIMLLLLFKFIILTIIWAVCFSHPTDRSLDATAIEQHLLSRI